MDDFFASFPRFSRVLSNTNELEFARLRAMHGWTRSSSSFRKWYHAFRQAMLKETGSKVDNFFFSRYPSFDYYRLGSPKGQFERLQVSLAWNRQSEEERESATSDFMSAYSEDFNRNVDRFFAQYSDTGYNPRNEAKVEFENLRDEMGWYFPKEKTDWKPHHYRLEPKYCKAREGFFTAFIADFKCFFGVGDDVQDWVFLCDILRVSPAPPTVEECRQALAPFHVNIFNLLDHGQRKVPLIMHPDLEALKEYSIKYRRKFPLQRAEGTCMEFLLRRLDD